MDFGGIFSIFTKTSTDQCTIGEMRGAVLFWVLICGWLFSRTARQRALEKKEPFLLWC